MLQTNGSAPIQTKHHRPQLWPRCPRAQGWQRPRGPLALHTQSLQELCCDLGGCRAAAAFAQRRRDQGQPGPSHRRLRDARAERYPQCPGVLFCSASAKAVGSLWMALKCPRGSGCWVSSTHLVIHLLLHFQRERVVRPRAQHIWANADGQVAGVHPVGLGILADVVEQREQVLEQDEVWSRQLVSHPA